MENPEEILHSLEEFSKLKPKDIPRELEDYLCFVAKTGDPVYQWSAVKSLFREKLINVITEFYESCPTVEIPPCPNVEMFNYDSMKNFILEKLDTFAAAPFTVQRICELLTTPRKEYNRIDKYMRALEKNILVVSTTEPANRRNTENGEGIVNGIETEHLTEANSSNDINVEEMDDSPSWPRISQQETNTFVATENGNLLETQPVLGQETQDPQENISANESRLTPAEPSTSNTDSVITSTTVEKPFISIKPVVTEDQSDVSQDDVSVTITAIPAPVQKRRDSIEPAKSEDSAVSESIYSDTIEEESVKKTVEDKSENPSDEDSETNFENEQLPASESDSVSSETETDQKDLSKKHEEIEDIVEEASKTKDDEVSKEDPHNEPTPICVPQNEPETLQTCDNTQSTENNDSVDDSHKELSEESTEEIPKTNMLNVELIEPVPTVENELIGDNIENSTKENPKEENVLSTVEDIDPPKEIQSEETPMEVDSDEILIKESAVEVSTLETSPN